MAFFDNPAVKFEKAVRALIVLSGASKGSIDNSFISNDSRDRKLPNRTFLVTAFNPTRPYRPEGTCFLQIQHHFPAPVQPQQLNGIGQPDANAQQKALALFVGDTMDVLNMGGTNDQDMQPLATAITKAGRWLAIPDGTPVGDQIAADNSEMSNFRCDWVKFGSPVMTRGRSEIESIKWVEIIHIVGFVSHAST